MLPMSSATFGEALGLKSCLALAVRKDGTSRSAVPQAGPASPSGGEVEGVIAAETLEEPRTGSASSEVLQSGAAAQAKGPAAARLIQRFASDILSLPRIGL